MSLAKLRTKLRNYKTNDTITVGNSTDSEDEDFDQ